MNEQVIPVSGNQKIAFQCQRCSACCRHVENKVMLEPYLIVIDVDISVPACCITNGGVPDV